MAKNLTAKPTVGILMGSDSDLEVMQEAEKRLDYFGIAYETRIMSAHRTPEKAAEYAATAQQRGLGSHYLPARALQHISRGPSPQTRPCRSSAFPLIPPVSKVWTRCSLRCKCPPEFRWLPWRLARPAPPTPGSLPLKLLPVRIPESPPSSLNLKRRWPLVSKTETANSKAQNKAPENLAAAVEALKRGHVIVFPTETLYGLGADALNEAAVEKVFQLKGRDPHNPIPVLVADQEMLETLVAKVPTTAQRLIDQYWPGPLTLVLPGQKNIPKPFVMPRGGVGVRISSQPIATLLVNATWAVR